MEYSFKAEVARSATKYCKTNHAKCLPNTTRSRRGRSSGVVFFPDMLFSPDMVHILPGYPKQAPEDPKISRIALYVSLPPEISQSTVVSKDILTTIVERNMQSIGRSMDSSIVSVEPLSSPSTNEFRTNEPEGNHTGAIAGGVVGGCLLLVVGALLVIYLRKRRALRGVLYSRCLTSDPEESLPVIYNSTDDVLEMMEGVVSYSNNVYTVSPSESSRPSAVYESPMTVDNHASEETRYDESL
ncbi:uncharacterized protein LOC122947728 [Acropora millepora]|uniref:uncharacterized protein LOC122947728 n=1 Tax=Acropora millepora TaxID=45264 RepID=UPI001CF0F3D2|nr:uncharacterized protein LOC122947728 [Acropora millepora]